MQLFPTKKIQKFKSCFLWFYFQMLILINYNKKIQKEYKNADDVINSLFKMNIYFECINYYQNMVGLDKKLIEISFQSGSKTKGEDREKFQNIIIIIIIIIIENNVIQNWTHLILIIFIQYQKRNSHY